MTEPTVGAMEKFLRASSDVPWEADDELMDFARQQDALVAALLESNEVMRQDCLAIRGGDVPDDDELRELRAEIFRRAEGLPPKSKTSEWADRAQAISEAIDDYSESRIIAVGAAGAVKLAGKLIEIRQQDALVAELVEALEYTVRQIPIGHYHGQFGECVACKIETALQHAKEAR